MNIKLEIWDKYGWNYVKVKANRRTIEYDSYYEGKVEGNNFTMRKEGKIWKVYEDHTSWPVPGSQILWLHSVKKTSWAGVESPNPVTIPDELMEEALWTMIDDEVRNICINQPE